MPNPTVEKLLDGAAKARANNVDLILAVGGGSTIDYAKAVSALTMSGRGAAGIGEFLVSPQSARLMHGDAPATESPVLTTSSTLRWAAAANTISSRSAA